MKQAASLPLLLAPALLLTLALGTLGADDSTPTNSRTLTGEYFWQDAEVHGDLEAVFTPTGENEWNVEFHFTFRDQPRTYSGTAMGSLETGSLNGTVYGDSRRGRREWVFRGNFEEGTFRGDHAEVEDGEEIPSGTLTLH